MRQDRLAMVIAAVEAAPEDRLLMEGWEFPSHCGFAGCAIGWTLANGPADGMELRHGSLWFGSKRDLDAVIAWLEIDRGEARSLFLLGSYSDPGKHCVLERLRFHQRSPLQSPPAPAAPPRRLP